MCHTRFYAHFEFAHAPQVPSHNQGSSNDTEQIGELPTMAQDVDEDVGDEYSLDEDIDEDEEALA